MAARKSRRDCCPDFFDMISPLSPDYVINLRLMDWCNYWAFIDEFNANQTSAEYVKVIEKSQILATIADMLLPVAATEEE